MSPLGWHPPYLVDNTDTLHLGGPALTIDSVVFLGLYFFVLTSLPMCQSVCVSVDLL